MKPTITRGIYRKQQGAALLVALVLLVAATLTTLFTTRNLSFGIKSQANQSNAIVAHEAAMAGIDAALAMLANAANRNNLLTGSPAVGGWYNGRIYGFFRDATPDTHNLPDTVSITTASNATAPTIPTNVRSSFQVRIKRLSAPAGAEPNRAVRIEALGCADGQSPNAADTVCTARAIVTQSTLLKPSLASAPAAALTAKGNVSLSGNVAITNTDPGTNGTTIHSGGTVTGTGSADIVSLPGTPSAASVAGNDSTLSSLTADQYFQGFFGESKQSMQADAAQITCDGTACGAAVKALEGAGKPIWVNTTTGAQFNASGTGGQIGTAANPVILIVNGPLQITGNVTIYGVVYSAHIEWDNTGGGTSQIIGAAIAEGDFIATGTPNPTYDPAVIAALKSNLGLYVRLGGGWKDWCTDCSFTSW